MLQQTQVERVIPKYAAFLKAFPDFATLNRAPLAKVLVAWQGLGYNRRALMLKKLASRVVEDHGGTLPPDPALLAELPGIGKGTAGAVAAFAFGIRAIFIETNIRRVYLHIFFPKRRDVPDTELLDLISQTVDVKNPREWYYALMDYGAMLGRREKENPNRRSRHYAKQSRFEGSDRQVRGIILKMLLVNTTLSVKGMVKQTGESEARIKKVLAALEREGFLRKIGRMYGTNH